MGFILCHPGVHWLKPSHATTVPNRPADETLRELKELKIEISVVGRYPERSGPLDRKICTPRMLLGRWLREESADGL